MANEESEQEIQARLSALAGRINLHKQQQQNQYRGGFGGGYRGSNRYTPYAGRGRGRGGFQNMSTVFNTPKTPTTPSSGTGYSSDTGDASLGSGTTGPGAQHAAETAAAGTKVAPPTPRPILTPSKVDREMVIDGITFRMKEDGSKLTRISDDTSPATPKLAIVHGVHFLRTKNGNLLRKKVENPSAPKEQCEHFTKNGTCPYGSKCRFAHDTAKVAICKAFFRTGTCGKGDLCDLSHKPTYHRVPACTHYMSGNCTKDACRYAHVTVSPSTLVCRPFALLGYCDKGKSCDKQHVFECPDYAETGRCANDLKGQCKLQHVRHAHQERKRLRSDDESEVESSGDEEMRDEKDEIEEAASDDVLYGVEGSNHDISQNQDYISLS